MRAADWQEWLRLARQDVAVVRAILALDPPLVESALFHCAQAAEKALKSVIVGGKLSPQKTHDLDALLSVALAVRPSLNVREADARLLSRYAVDPRYPGDHTPYREYEAVDALAAAERVLRAVGEGSGNA